MQHLIDNHVIAADQREARNIVVDLLNAFEGGTSLLRQYRDGHDPEGLELAMRMLPTADKLFKRLTRMIEKRKDFEIFSEPAYRAGFQAGVIHANANTVTTTITHTHIIREMGGASGAERGIGSDREF